MTEEELNGKYIFIAVPTRGEVRLEMCQWLGDITRKPYKGYSFVVKFNYIEPIDGNRNYLVNKFLEDPRNEWLLFVDDDMAPYSDLVTMIDHGEKVVSGLTCAWQNEKPAPLLMKYQDGNMEMYDRQSVEDVLSGEGGLIEVDGVGAACLLIHREVLEKVKPPWFKFEYDDKGRVIKSEDYRFCKAVKDAGYKIYVDPDNIVGHCKKIDIVKINALIYQALANKDVAVVDLTKFGTVGKLVGRGAF